MGVLGGRGRVSFLVVCFVGAFDLSSFGSFGLSTFVARRRALWVIDFCVGVYSLADDHNNADNYRLLQLRCDEHNSDDYDYDMSHNAPTPAAHALVRGCRLVQYRRSVEFWLAHSIDGHSDLGWHIS